jgi:hypothetical protein
MILHKFYQRIHVYYCANGKNIKKIYKVSVEQRVSTWSRYPEGKYGHRTNTSISRLGEDIPHTCRCINHSTWSYLGATRNERFGPPYSLCEQKATIIITKLQNHKVRRSSYGLRTTKIQTLLIGKTF